MNFQQSFGFGFIIRILFTLPFILIFTTVALVVTMFGRAALAMNFLLLFVIIFLLEYSLAVLVVYILFKFLYKRYGIR